MVLPYVVHPTHDEPNNDQRRARRNRREGFAAHSMLIIVTEPGTRNLYGFSPASQFNTTVIGAGGAVVVSDGSALIRNFWPSAVTS